jgi:hypothetical protein
MLDCAESIWLRWEFHFPESHSLCDLVYSHAKKASDHSLGALIFHICHCSTPFALSFNNDMLGEVASIRL